MADQKAAKADRKAPKAEQAAPSTDHQAAKVPHEPARLRVKYNTEIRTALQKELGLDNIMAVPKIDKIVVNMGLGEATQNTKLLDPLVADLAQLTGQKPVTT